MAYCHSIPTIRAEGRWWRGTYSRGITVPFSDGCFGLIKNKDESPVRITKFIHAHPKSIIPEDAKIPPSFLDLMSAVQLIDTTVEHLPPPVMFRMIVVEASRTWEVNINREEFKLYVKQQPEKMSKEALEILDELEPIYLCESLPDRTPEDCVSITLIQREQAVDRLLEIYTVWGITITETPRTPRGQAI